MIKLVQILNEIKILGNIPPDQLIELMKEINSGPKGTNLADIAIKYGYDMGSDSIERFSRRIDQGTRNKVFREIIQLK